MLKSKLKLEKFLNNSILLSSKSRTSPDKWIPLICFLLLIIGFIVIYSIGPALGLTTGVSGSYYVTRYIIAIILSIIVFYITSKISMKTWRSYINILLGAALLATLIALLLPVNPNYPAHRWVRFAGLSFESVELLIFAFLIWLADFLAKQIHAGLIKSFKKTAIPLLIALIVLGGIIAGAQSDLGSTGVIVAILFGLVFVAGFPMKRILIIGAIVTVGTFLAIITSPYRIARVQTFFHPDTNCLTTGYQSCQAIIAVGSGGLTGVGLGSSVQAYGYLPEADNDSIFAIFAEKFGFIGSVVLLGIYLVLFYKIYRVGVDSKDNFSKLIVLGVLIWISIEVVINIGAMIGLLPLKGITLPFVSYGGSSVIFFAAAIGLVYQISSNNDPVSSRIGTVINNRNKYENNFNRSRVRGAYHPSVSHSSRDKETLI